MEAEPVRAKLALSTVKLPEAFPGTVGANPTVNDMFPFAGSVTGRVGTPLSEKTAPLALTLLIVVGVDPALTI